MVDFNSQLKLAIQITPSCSLLDKRKDFQTVKLAGGILTADGNAAESYMAVSLCDSWKTESTHWMVLYTTGNEHTFRGRNLLYNPVILNQTRNEWDYPSMKSRVRLFTIWGLFPSQPVVYLSKLMAEDWVEGNFILHSVQFGGGREWIGQTDILLKATSSSFTQETEGQRVPQASILTWNAFYLSSRTWVRKTLANFSIQYLKLEEQEGVVPSSCIDLLEHLATETRSTPCFQGCLYWENSPWWQFWARNSLHFSKLFLLPAED